MKVAILFDNFGPYHLARLNAASRVCTLLAVEVNSRSRDYAWRPSAPPRDFRSTTLSNYRRPALLQSVFQASRIRSRLGLFLPDCVFIPGWSRLFALQSLGWCMANRVPAILMSETTEHDAARSCWKEWLKGRIVRRCSAGLVGGTLHAEYLEKLGMPGDRIFQGYDVVDNDYFARESTSAREREDVFRRTYKLPRRYFLASARFIGKKNLGRLIIAFEKYRRAALKPVASGHRTIESQPWSLVLLGDGEQRKMLETITRDLRLEACVHLPGFRQYEELPVFYGLAGVFVHASVSEPWGLVVNEAMASGLPVMVSNRCGCSRELVREGRNGFTFDPEDVEQLAGLMLRLGRDSCQITNMGRASVEIIADWGPSRFADAVRAAAQRVVGGPRPDILEHSGQGAFAESFFQ